MTIKIYTTTRYQVDIGHCVVSVGENRSLYLELGEAGLCVASDHPSYI